MPGVQRRFEIQSPQLPPNSISAPARTDEECLAIQFPLLLSLGLWTGPRISREERYSGFSMSVWGGLIYSVTRNVLVATANKFEQVSWSGASAMPPRPFALPQSVLAMAVHHRLWRRIDLVTIRSKSMTSPEQFLLFSGSGVKKTPWKPASFYEKKNKTVGKCLDR